VSSAVNEDVFAHSAVLGACSLNNLKWMLIMKKAEGLSAELMYDRCPHPVPNSF
jgi:hypothetical protein